MVKRLGYTVTYLLFVSSRSTCLAYSVKTDPGPLNIFSLPADTEALSSEGTEETFLLECLSSGGTASWCQILTRLAPAAWAASPAPGSCSIPQGPALAVHGTSSTCGQQLPLAFPPLVAL